MEAAPFDVRTEDDPHAVVDVPTLRFQALNAQGSDVAPVRKRERERKSGLVAHAARHGELPSREPPRRIGDESGHALAVEFARVALALQPAPCPRPQVDAVGRHVRIRIRRKNRVVLRTDRPPAKADLCRRAGAIGKNRPVFGMKPDLLARKVLEDLGLPGVRWNEKTRTRADCPSVFIDRQIEVERAATRAVAMIMRRIKDDLVPVLGTAYANRLRRLGIDEPHAEMGRRRNFDELPLGDNDIALRVAWHDDVEKRNPVRRNGRRHFRKIVGPLAAAQAQHLPRCELDRLRRIDLPSREDVKRIRDRELSAVPVDPCDVRAIKIRQHQKRGLVIHCASYDRKRVTAAARDDREMSGSGERRMRPQETVQTRNESDHVLVRAPVEIVLPVDVDLLLAKPLDAVGDAPGALPREKRRQLDAKSCIDRPALRESVVVVRLGKVDKRTELLGAPDRIRKIRLELSAIISLEDLRIRPVEIGFGQQTIRDLEPSAQTLQHEDRVRILLAHFGDDVLPSLGWNHVARVAPEAVDAGAAPEEEDVRHVGAEPGIRVVELHKIGPGNTPRTGADELAVLLAMKPVGVMRLQCRRPARMVRGEINQNQAFPRVHGADQFPKLVQWRRVFVEFGHRRIDREKVRRGERATVLAHHRICCRDGKRRQGLNDPETHRVHDEREPADDLAERSELPRKDAVN